MLWVLVHQGEWPFAATWGCAAPALRTRACRQHLPLSNTRVPSSLSVAGVDDRRKSCVRGETDTGNHIPATAVCGGSRSLLPLRLLFLPTQAFRDPTTVDSIAALAATACPQRCFSRKAFSPTDLKECHQYPCLQV